MIGYAAGALGGSVIRAAWWIPVVTAAVGQRGRGRARTPWSVEVLGQATLSGPSLTAIVAVVAAVNAVLAPVAVRAMRWALVDDTAGRRYSPR